MRTLIIRLWIQMRTRYGSCTGSRGASLVEYAFLVALIAIVCMAAVVFLGTSTSEDFESSGSSLFTG